MIWELLKLTYLNDSYKFSADMGRSGGLLSVWGNNVFVEVDTVIHKSFILLDDELRKECRELIIEFFGNHRGNKSDLSLKLRKLKGALNKWNIENCRNFVSKVHVLEHKINRPEESGNEGGLDNSKLQELKLVRLELVGFTTAKRGVSIDWKR
ncbi:hypothetical protein GQ457_07G011230 [Hibiscus cannabinus]